MKILFTGGGTGGHVFPIIAIVREIRKIYPKDKLEFYHIGPKDNFSQMLLSQEDIKTKTILAGKIRRYPGRESFFQNALDLLFKIPLGTIQAFFFIFFLSPDLIFSKGGYASLPVIFANWIFEIPVFLHESDVAPGLGNKASGKLAVEIFVSFPKTEYFARERMLAVGNPIRKEVLNGSRERAKEIFKLTGEKPVILVLGGSQGAQKINDVLISILPEMLESFEIIHQCGEGNFKQVETETKMVVKGELEKYYHLYAFLHELELKHAYQASDLIVSRAGAGSIFEIAALAKPSILIPLRIAAQNHQIKNAYAYAENGACLVMEEENLTPRFFLEKLKFLFSHPEELEKMVQKTAEFAKPEAAQIIAKYIIEYLLKK